MLDSRRVPAGPLLLGLHDGALVAAVAVGSDVAIADPFRPTDETVELLRVRAAHLRGAARHRGAASLLGRRIRAQLI